jgi:gliding motility-associatede transport system auxiliary component
MKRLMGILGWLGVALVVAALILRFTKADQPALYQGLAYAGLAVTLLYAASQWRDIARSFQSRGAKYGSIALGGVLVFAAILVAINWIAQRQTKRWDLTETQQFSLSDQTRSILAGLKAPLKIRVFHQSQDKPQRYRDRFEPYQYLSKNVTTEYIDAEVNPAQAQKFEIVALPTIVLEYQGRTQRAQSPDEQAVTNALKKLIEGKTKKAYFVQGHNERDPDDASTNNGIKAAADLLLDENFEIGKVALLQTGKVPADATVLVIAGPTVDLAPQEADIIGSYLKNGGKVLLMIDPPEKAGPVQATSMVALAKSWGIQVNNDLIVDPQGQLVGANASVPVGLPSEHAITKGYRIFSAFSLARSVAPVEGGADGKFAQKVVETGAESWSESDVKGLYETGRPTKDPAKGDKPGPLAVGAAVSAPAAPAPAPSDAPPAADGPKAESRLVVFGDSDFATNRWIRQLGNGDLFLNSVNWLAQQEDLIAIRPRDPEDRRIEMTLGAQWAVLIFMCAIPLLLFGNAVRVYWKRR